MAQRFPILLFTIVLIACHTSFDPGRVDKGMTARQLIETVGRPQEKLHLTAGVSLWRYEDDHTVIMSEGQVMDVGIMTDADLQRTMQGMQEAMDSLQKARIGTSAGSIEE